MSYIKLTNGVPENYSIAQLKKDNTNISFPKKITDEILADFDVYPLIMVEIPDYDVATQRIEKNDPELIDGQWVQNWTVVDLDGNELTQSIEKYNERQKQARQFQFSAEADSLFFGWHRGENEKQIWLDKVDEIRALYPYHQST